MLIVASLAQMRVAAGLALALDSVAAILVLAALLGVGFAVAQPAEFALVPVIGGPERLKEINGLVETARYAGMTAGPLIGGVLAGLGGTEVAMLVNAGTFAVVAASALLLRARRRPQPAGADDAPDRARDGVVFLFRDRQLGLVMAVLFVSLLFMTASATAEVFFLKEDLEVSDAIYGVVFGAWTIGMVLGALVVARRVPEGALALGALVAVAIQGLGLGLPTVWLAVGFGAGDVADRRAGPRDQERAGPDADPGARARPPPRPRLRGLQRAAQRRRAVRARGRRRAGGGDRRARDARARGRDPDPGGARRAGALPQPAPLGAHRGGDRAAARGRGHRAVDGGGRVALVVTLPSR